MATCGAHQIAPPKSPPGGGAWLCYRRSLMCIILIVNDIAYSLWCYDGLPPPPGWQLGAPSGGPRMSPRPCVAKYGATHSANHLPGLEITSPFVIFSSPGVAATIVSRPKPFILHATPGAASAPCRRLPQSGFPVYSPALTQLCRDQHNKMDCVPKVRPL